MFIRPTQPEERAAQRPSRPRGGESPAARSPPAATSDEGDDVKVGVLYKMLMVFWEKKQLQKKKKKKHGHVPSLFRSI